eukprot:GDKJ01017990.1.p1 GENE.GDKJ01017990.1~~GDKJ01017990.1.p1  ORF type:complete len:163 (+),score=37.02 GDKJ01017990.1:1-489(+)
MIHGRSLLSGQEGFAAIHIHDPQAEKDKNIRRGGEEGREVVVGILTALLGEGGFPVGDLGRVARASSSGWIADVAAVLLPKIRAKGKAALNMGITLQLIKELPALEQNDSFKKSMRLKRRSNPFSVVRNRTRASKQRAIVWGVNKKQQSTALASLKQTGTFQ